MDARSTTLVDAVTGRITEQPDRPALVWRDDAVTYGELGALVSASADALAALDGPAGGPVAMAAEKSPEAIAVILACLSTRRPLALPSPELGAAALDALAQRAGCRYVIAPRRGGLSVRAVVGTAGSPPGGDPCGSSASPSHGALMLTTSGSTGQPKIVPIALEAIDRFVHWAGAHFEMAAGTCVLNHAPLNFDICLLDVWASLARGACVVLVEPADATRPDRLVRLVTTHEVRLVQAVPLFYRLVLDAAVPARLRLPSVEHVVITGDSMSPRDVAAVSDVFDRAVLHNVYGCTETNDSFIGTIDVADAHRRGAVPIGSPLPGVKARLVTTDGSALIGPGAGELWVSTPFQTGGYLDSPPRGDAFVDGVDEGGTCTWYRTGDVVRRHGDGALTVEGRQDFHVKVRGVRVNVREVEDVLERHGDVAEAAVVAVADETRGTQLRAVVRRRPNTDLDALVVRQHCAAWLARVAIPSTITVVDLPLPRTATGKVDRARLLRPIGRHHRPSHPNPASKARSSPWTPPPS